MAKQEKLEDLVGKDGDPILRKSVLTITEIVPEHDRLPQCEAVTATFVRCLYAARYRQNDVFVCGHHVGRQTTMWWPKPKRIK